MRFRHDPSPNLHDEAIYVFGPPDYEIIFIDFPAPDHQITRKMIWVVFITEYATHHPDRDRWDHDEAKTNWWHVFDITEADWRQMCEHPEILLTRVLL